MITKVFGENGCYRVKIKVTARLFELASVKNRFISTRDIIKTVCEKCTKIQGFNKCKHIAAVLTSLIDQTPIQSPLQSWSDCTVNIYFIPSHQLITALLAHMIC